MTYKDKCEYLSRYIRAVRSIEASCAEYERWAAIGAKVNQIYSQEPPIPHDDRSSRVETAAIKMAEIMAGIKTEIEQAVNTKAEVLTAISRAKKHRQAELLTWRFVKDMGVAAIAAMLGKDARTISSALRRAINSLDI